MKQKRLRMKWLDTIAEHESEQVQSSMPQDDLSCADSDQLDNSTIGVSIMLDNLDICSLDSTPSDSE